MKISPQSKSFIVLMIVAISGTFICLILWGVLMQKRLNYLTNKAPSNSQNTEKQQDTPPRQSVDTSTWKTYTNEKYKISFKYNPEWTVLPPKNKNGFNYIEIDPGAKYFNMRIYISPETYYIMEGLPTVSETINGNNALNVNYALYGIQTKNWYYTFDVGLSMPLVPQFDAMVHTVQFLD